MGRFRTIYLHVGLDKTGSTALQTALLLSAERLEKAGFYYPRHEVGSAHGQLGSCFSEPRAPYIFNRLANRTDEETIRALDQAYLAALRQELERTSAAELILSYEGFVNLGPDALSRLAAFLQELGERVVVVAYCRPPLSYALSAASQRVKSGEPPWQPLAVHLFAIYFNRLMDAFGEGNLIVRRFGPRYLDGGDIVTDFCRALSIPDGVVAPPASPASGNASLTREGIEIGARLVAKLDGELQVGAEFAEQWRDILDTIGGQRPVLPPEVAEAVRAKAAPHLAFLRERFAIDLGEEDESMVAEGEALEEGLADSLVEALLLAKNGTGRSRDVRGVILPVDAPARIRAGEEVAVTVDIRNDTPGAWRSTEENPVHLSYHWLTREGKTKVLDGVRTSLGEKGVEAHTWTRLAATVTAPGDPGDYVLELTLVKEGVCWFEQEPSGFRSAQVGVRVTAPGRRSRVAGLRRGGGSRG